LDRPTLPYDELFESHPLPMWVYDLESLRFLAVNDAAVERYGWPREEFLALTLRDIRPPEDVPSLEAGVVEAAVTVVRSGVWRHRTRSGEVMLVEISSHTFRFEGREARLVTVHDVTAQEFARISDERFRLVTRATTDAIWDWNLVTNDVWWNEGATRLFGHAEDMAYHPADEWVQRIHPEDRARITTSVDATIRGSGDEWADEYRYMRADGSYAIVSDRGFVIRGADGTPLRMVGGMTDLTERREMEARMLRAQRMEGIGTLAGGIAHDLNNMLSPILMSIDLLREHVHADEGQQVLNTIEASAKRGADLVRQVLTYARGVDGQREALAVVALVGDLARMVADTFPKQVRLDTDVPEGIWAIVGDTTQMHQVLMNLFVNARDAMPDGGTITLAAANVLLTERDAAPLSDAHPGPFVRLSIVDTGTGMSERVCERIFEPFFTTKGVGKGTGLGLSTVQAIVRSHGGFVTVRSVPGKGTTFEVHLPAETRGVADAGPARRLTPVRGIGELLLLVDDEPHIRMFASRLLERKGYRVVSAGGGEEGLTAFSANLGEVALVITDMQMPKFDGRALIDGIRRVAPAIPVIAMSGLGLPELRAPGAEAGARGVIHLMKPFTSDQLDAAVRRALSQR
jgi:PAS domain S-box-containing protein